MINGDGEMEFGGYYILFFPIKVMRQSKNSIIKHCFPSTEPDSKKRPETVRNDSNDDAHPLIL